MNAIIIVCLGFLCYVHFAQSAVAVLKDSRDPAYPGKCVSNNNENQIIINPGESTTDRKYCTRISCGLGYQMQFASCGKVGFPLGCHLSAVDQTKDYPDCCPKIVCPENLNLI